MKSVMRLFRIINSKIIKGKIKNRILAYSIGLLMFNLVIIAAASYYISSVTIVERITETNRQILEQTMGNIDFVLKSVESTAVQVFDNETLSELLDKAQTASLTEFGDYDREITAIIKKLLILRDETEYGYVVSKGYLNGDRYGMYSNELYARLQRIDFKMFEKLAESSGDRFVWTFTIKETPDVITSKRIALCRAIKNKDHEYMGLTLILLKQGILKNIYSNLIQEERYVFLANNDGTVVSASDEAYVGLKITDVYRLRSDGTTAVMNANGERVVVYNTVSPYTGWTLYIAEPYKNSVSAVRSMRLWIAAVMLTCLLVFICLSIVMSNMLTKPIKWLLESVSSVDGPGQLKNPAGIVERKHNWIFSFLKRFSFKTKLSAMLLSIVMIPIMILMIISTSISFRVIKEKAEEINALNTEQMKIKVEYYLDSFEKSLYEIHLGNTLDIRSGYEILNEINNILRMSVDRKVTDIKLLDENGEIRDIIASMRRKNVDILYIDLYNRERQLIYSYGGNKMTMPDEFFNRLDGVSDIKNMWFGPYKDNYNDHIITLGKRLLDPTNFSFDGYAFISIREADVGKSYEKSSGSNARGRDIAFITNKNGYPVSYPDKSAFGEKLKYNFMDELIQREGDSFTGRIDGDEFIISSSPIKNTDWIIVNASSLESVRNNMRVLYLYYLLVLVFSTVVIANIVLRVSRQIVKPLKELEERVVSFANGNLEQDRPIEPGDEVEQLNKSFNNMMMRIKTLIEEVYEVKIRENEAALKSKQAELTLLQAQINPHFLYNTLEIIRWKAMFLTGSENEVTDLVTTLSDFFRLSLSKGEKMIPLRDELEHARNYLAIINHRYNEKIKAFWHIDEDVKACLVPKIILQPVVENAVYHGIKPKQGEGIIEIYASKKDGVLEIRVCDNGLGMDEEKLKRLKNYISGEESVEKVGYGLKNINQRIRLRFGEEYGLTVESTPNSGTAVIIRMPPTYPQNPGGKN